ncbi:MAG: hypothetical protein JO355_03885, partial [Planctomycetaceae bacterium]|nr:hypothetical protein [Planctomycetaceae bacterium]
MRRHGHFWEGMIAFENLLRAAEKARRGKRFRPPAARFFFHLERELTRLHDELAAKTYRPGPYRTFTLHEGKARQISAAPFQDRVVHHALTGVLEPILRAVLRVRQLRLPQGQGHPRRGGPLPGVRPPLPLRPE